MRGVEPFPPMRCRHFGECGGCSLPGMPYGEQLERKRAWLERLLGRPVPAVVPSPTQARFRHKVAFVFGAARAGRGLVMGHYAGGSRRIVPIRECPVHSERGNRIAFALRDALARARVPPRLLRHVLVRTTLDEREAVAMLVVRRNDRTLRPPVRELLDSPDRPDGFFLNLHEEPNPFLFGETTIHVDGRRQALETGLGPCFLISPTAFFQPNVAAARRLLDLVLEGVGDAAPVLDLYCGGGLMSLPLAQRGVPVVAVEENPRGIEDLQANLRANRLAANAVRPVCARVEAALRRGFGEEFGAVILDPPRSGCAPGVIDGVFGRLRPPRAVYVSCNPQVLARDLRRVLDLGYRVERIAPVDMFPHTDHLETVVTFRAAGGKGGPGGRPPYRTGAERGGPGADRRSSSGRRRA